MDLWYTALGILGFMILLLAIFLMMDAHDFLNSKNSYKE